jgi:hypothetical protein
MKKVKRFQMIRSFHLADWITLGNAACGVGALFSTMTYLQTQDIRHFLFACGLIPLAMVFDVLDGRVARWRQKTSAMGRELDSLADVISFGVAPAAIAYAALGPRRATVFCRLRCQSSRPLQHHGRSIVARRRQGEIFRRHTDSNLVVARRRACRRGRAGSNRGPPLVRYDPHCTVAIPSFSIGVCRVRFAYDQPHSYSKIVTNTLVAEYQNGHPEMFSKSDIILEVALAAAKAFSPRYNRAEKIRVSPTTAAAPSQSMAG